MKKLIPAIILFMALNSFLFSQNSIENVLQEIEKNNTTLSALRKKGEAEKIGNKIGNYLQNPEIEFNYLWGNPASIGNRTDFSLKQEFDFPTAYGYRNQISTIKNEQLKLEYEKKKKELLLETRLICYDLIYMNAFNSELSKRITHAKSISNSYKIKLEVGEANILDYNKAQLNLLNLTKEAESIQIRKEELLGKLRRLNAGIPIYITEFEFEKMKIPTNFEEWYAIAEQNNPLLNWLKKEMELNQKQINLSQALYMPKLSAAYMSESVIGQKFKGISLGLSIPLWQKKNTVKYAKANTETTEKIAFDNKVRIYNNLKSMYSKTIGLNNSYLDYQSKLLKFNNSDLLKIALDKGEISLINYMLELSMYYSSVDILLELKRDMNKSLAELNQYI